MFTYKLLVDKYTNDKLDKDSKSIIYKYSTFYIFRDYDLLIQYLMKNINNKDFFNFLLYNNFHFFLTRKCNDLLIKTVNEDYSLDDIDDFAYQIILKYTNQTYANIFLTEIYYDNDFSYIRPIEYVYIDSRDFISKELKKLNISDVELKSLFKYMAKNINKYLNILTYFSHYKDTFMDFTKKMNNF